MEIDAVHLILYFTVWTIFYFYLSHYIAELSRKRWTAWVQSEDSDEVLMEALEVIVNEIEYLMKRGDLGGLEGLNSPEKGVKQPQKSPKLGLE